MLEWGLAFDSLCGVRTGVRERLLAFDSLWTGLVVMYIVCLCELCYYRFNFRTILLIVRTPGKIVYSIEFERQKRIIRLIMVSDILHPPPKMVGH